MRAVFFHLIGTTRQAMCEYLDVRATPNGVEHWTLPHLYLNFYDDLLAEAEPGDLEALNSALGSMPEVSLAVHISGRVPGDELVLQLAALILGHFCGVAWDDYTTHCWTLPEIQAGVQVNGHRFFDYEGWYLEHTNARMCGDDRSA